MLASLDRNHDGQLSPDEYQDIPGDTIDHQTTAMFAGMGKYMGNGDGIITQDEMGRVGTPHRRPYRPARRPPGW